MTEVGSVMDCMGMSAEEVETVMFTLCDAEPPVMVAAYVPAY